MRSLFGEEEAGRPALAEGVAAGQHHSAPGVREATDAAADAAASAAAADRAASAAAAAQPVRERGRR